MTTLNHGEIVSWDIKSGTIVSLNSLRAALTAAGFDDGLAKAMAPRNAFARASHDLDTARIIKRVNETATTMDFQFTAETKVAGRLVYNFEALLKLDKITGRVTCSDSAELEATAQQLITEESEKRYNCDITRIVQKIMDEQGDFFSVRAQGGCYFVPHTCVGLLDKLENLLASVGGSLRRFPIQAGTKSGDRSVKESVQDGLNAVVGEHLRAIEAFDDSTRESTLEKMVKKINETRFKAEAYAEFLADEKAAVESKLAEARKQLREKIQKLGKGVPVPEPEAQAQAA